MITSEYFFSSSCLPRNRTMKNNIHRTMVRTCGVGDNECSTARYNWHNNDHSISRYWVCAASFWSQCIDILQRSPLDRNRPDWRRRYPRTRRVVPWTIPAAFGSISRNRANGSIRRRVPCVWNKSTRHLFRNVPAVVISTSRYDHWPPR